MATINTLYDFIKNDLFTDETDTVSEIEMYIEDGIPVLNTIDSVMNNSSEELKNQIRFHITFIEDDDIELMYSVINQEFEKYCITRRVMIEKFNR